eukprot:9319924-Pyramimonas_sp.AAC.1
MLKGKDRGTKHHINIRSRSSARISCIGAGAPWRHFRLRPRRAPRGRDARRGPALIQEIWADLHK